jgi:hypothetical protein
MQFGGREDGDDAPLWIGIGDIGEAAGVDDQRQRAVGLIQR